MSGQLGFRYAKEEDTPLIFTFIKGLASYEKRPEDVKATEEGLRKWIFEKNLAEVFFILEEEKEIGFALYYFNFSTFSGTPGLYLEDLFILPEYRGKGYGTAAFRKLAQTACSRGCGRMEWSCLDWNLPGIRFYEGLGAKIKGGNVKFRLEEDAMRGLAE